MDKPFTKFVNHHAHTGLERKKPESDTDVRDSHHHLRQISVQKQVLGFLSNLVKKAPGEAQPEAAAKPEVFSNITENFDPARLTLQRLAAVYRDRQERDKEENKPEENQSARDAAATAARQERQKSTLPPGAVRAQSPQLDAEPYCLENLFWDLRIEWKEDGVKPQPTPSSGDEDKTAEVDKSRSGSRNLEDLFWDLKIENDDSLHKW